MANIFTLSKRSKGQLGIVKCADFENGTQKSAYIGYYVVNNKGCLMIYGEEMSDFTFTKDDVESLSVLSPSVSFEETSIVFLFKLKSQTQGTKYAIKFKNGKTAIAYINGDMTHIFERVIGTGVENS